MVKKQHKVLCLVLCLALVVSTAMIGLVTAFAASGDTIYCKAKSSWSTVYVYMWNGGGETKNADWPGQQMTKGSDGIYYYSLPADYANVIFNNGSGDQTGDMSYPGNSKQYNADEGGWTDYSGSTPAPQPGTTPQPVTTPTPSGDNIVYFRNTDNWSSVNCYMWNSESDRNSGWPGVSMTNLGEGVWSYTASKKFANVIFNNGNAQTADLTANYGQLFDYGKNAWEAFDLSDLRVSSFTASPDADIYTDSDVTLSAEASNKNGAAVYYQFTVTNAAGSTSTLSDFSSAKSVTWTPTNAGSYTLTCNFKDTEGNELQRTLSVTVKSDVGSAAPIIKKVTPAHLNLVKKNATATVSVTAGGGQVGTNLLFYKYIVTDPNGVENTPYYTLNSRYDFTPTKLGNYNVEVFVQASDNTTVSRVYTYTVTDSDLPEPTTAQAYTTPAPTTVPQPVTRPVQPTTTPVVTTTPVKPGEYQLGDVNKDGRVDVKDATYVQRHCAEFADARNIDLALGDLNGDGKITVADATAIQVLIAT